MSKQISLFSNIDWEAVQVSHPGIPDSAWSAGQPSFVADDRPYHSIVRPPDYGIPPENKPKWTIGGVVYTRTLDHWEYTYDATDPWSEWTDRVYSNITGVFINNEICEVPDVQPPYTGGTLNVIAYMKLVRADEDPDATWLITVEASPANGGVITIDGEAISSKRVPRNGSATVRETPNAGFAFKWWTFRPQYGDRTFPGPAYVLTPTGDLSCVAYFRRATGKLLCTGSDSSAGAGKMLCDSSGNLLYDG